MELQSPVAPTLPVPAPSDITCDKEAEQDYLNLKAFCQRRKNIDIADAMASFPSVQAFQLKR